MEHIKIENAKTRLFESKEHYLKFKQAWKDFHNSDKLVWRGTSSQALPDLSDPQRLTDHINATVAAILEQFPPGRRPDSGGYSY